MIKERNIEPKMQGQQAQQEPRVLRMLRRRRSRQESYAEADQKDVEVSERSEILARGERTNVPANDQGHDNCHHKSSGSSAKGQENERCQQIILKLMGQRPDHSVDADSGEIVQEEEIARELERSAIGEKVEGRAESQVDIEGWCQP
jgi:hypothetical protein